MTIISGCWNRDIREGISWKPKLIRPINILDDDKFFFVSNLIINRLACELKSELRQRNDEQIIKRKPEKSHRFGVGRVLLECVVKS